MKALVTGAAGFIGSFLCPELARRGVEIRAVAFPGEEAGELAAQGFEVRFADLTDPAAVKGLCDGVDVVFHLAGRLADWGPRKAYYSIMYDATRYLLDECSGRVPRFVYVSSVCALGMGIHLKGWREDYATTKTGIPYGDAKLDAERLLWQYQARGETVGTVIRPCNVIGPRSIWVWELIDKYRKGPLPLVDKGEHSASLIYVENLVEGMALAGTLPAGEGKTFHFRDDWEVTWRQYLTDLGAMVGKKPAFSVPFPLAWRLALVFEKALTPLGVRPPFTRHSVGLVGRDLDIDCSRAKEDLGWSTRVSYPEAMERIREWVSANM